MDTQPGDREEPNHQFFVQNGGAFYYEFLPTAADGGLLEGATPECSSPRELLTYQRAQETLLIRALPLATEKLAQQGIIGDFGLLKNCRDAEGHTYGTQENYATELASGPALWCYRLVALLSLPGIFALALVMIALVIVMLLLFLCFMIVWGVSKVVLGFLELFLPPRKFWRRLRHGIGRLGSAVDGWFSGTENPHNSLAQFFLYIGTAINLPLLYPYALTLRVLGFRKQRRAMTAFLASRCIWSGAGTVLDDGTFALAEKGVDLRGLMRKNSALAARVIYDTSNLLKLPIFAVNHSLSGRGQALNRLAVSLNRRDPDRGQEQWEAFKLLILGRPDGMRRLFNARQRMQVGYSDSNRCQLAEYLRLGVTQLILDMGEAGALGDAPQLVRPVPAAKAIMRDPSMTVTVRVRGGRELSALEIQRWYLDAARRYLADQSDGSSEFLELVDAWGEVLDALEKDPGTLIGRVDWVSKRYLLETAGADVGPDERKKIDLKYHELGYGYFELLEREGIAPVLVDFEEIERAIEEPPSPESAQRRSRLIRDVTHRGKRAHVSWDSARIDGEPEAELFTRE